MASAVNFEITKIFDYARRLLIIILLGSAVGFTPAIAQEDDQQIGPEDAGKAESKTPDIKNGLIIARALCSTCHLIGEPPNSSVSADVPSFPSIASRPGQSMERLSSWLIEPHPPMPNVHLTRKEIRDLSGYILSLRSTQ